MQSSLKFQHNPLQTMKEQFSTSFGEKNPRIDKTNLHNKGTSESITNPDVELYYRYQMKTTWYQHKYRQVDLWNQIEDPDINSHMYEHLTFGKEG